MEKDAFHPCGEEEKEVKGNVEDSIIPEAAGDEKEEAPQQKEEHSEVQEAKPPSAEEAVEIEPVDIQKLREKIAELEKEKEEMKNRLLRMYADFENFRRRSRKEKDELLMYANFNLLQKLLPVIDNLERALLASEKGPDGIAEGLELIKKHFLDILAKEGVCPIESVGQPFDPNYHEAVAMEESSGYPAGTVVEELEKGYMFKEKVLRVSKVKVAAE